MNDRREYFKAYADFIESFQGRFITAEDSGTGVADMDVMAEVTHHVLGTSAGSGDPSPYTALGVRRSIEAAVKHRQNRSDLQGLRIAIQGLGHVGYALAQELADHGAELTVTDIDAETVQRCADEFGARPVSPQAIYSVDCDVFAPCALGAVLNDQTLRQLQARIIAGSANNQLLARSHGQELHCRRILYAPDYVANAGGLIYLALAKAGESEAVIKTRVEAIYATLLEHKQSGQQLKDIFPELAELLSGWAPERFEAWLQKYGSQAYTTTATGRRIGTELPKDFPRAAAQLTAALQPIADKYPLPYFRVGR
jgi:leucine dehydrogenase